jgi:hypothetical protein
LNSVSGQVINDAGLWTTFNVEKKLNKKVSFFLTDSSLSEDNFSEIFSEITFSDSSFSK